MFSNPAAGGSIPPHMSVVQITRGTAALPPDLEEKFRRAFGREMNQEERKFFGLKPRKEHERHAARRNQQSKAA